MVHSRAYVNAIAQNDLDTLKQKAPNTIPKIDDLPIFQIQVANGQLEKPLATITPKFEIGENILNEHFVIRKKLTGLVKELLFMRNNSVVIDTTHGLILFPHLTMQVKIASNEITAKPQPVFTDDAFTIPLRTRKTTTAFVDHPLEWNTTGTVTPLEKFTKTTSLLISHSMSTKIDEKIVIREINILESPYLIKKNTQIAELPVVTREQSMHNKPVDMAILSMIPQADRDLLAHLNELP